MDLITFLIVLAIFIIITIAFTLWKNIIPKKPIEIPVKEEHYMGTTPTPSVKQIVVLDSLNSLLTSEKQKEKIDRASQKSSEFAKRYSQVPVKHSSYPKSVTKHGEYVAPIISSNFMDESPIIAGISDVVFMDNLIDELPDNPIEFGGGNFGGGGAGDDYSSSNNNDSSSYDSGSSYDSSSSDSSYSSND